MRVIRSKSLHELTGVDVTPKGSATWDSLYWSLAMTTLCYSALGTVHSPYGVRASANSWGLSTFGKPTLQFLRLRSLRLNDRRLAALGEIAGVELEPYPLTTAGCHINFYAADTMPIAFHTDGAAMVELIPLVADGDGDSGATLVYNGVPDEGEVVLQDGYSLSKDTIERVPQEVGNSVLLQGRMLLHGAEPVRRGQTCHSGVGFEIGCGALEGRQHADAFDAR
jgi:hypothetical protein